LQIEPMQRLRDHDQINTARVHSTLFRRRGTIFNALGPPGRLRSACHSHPSR
jgi:hypothetical protein